MKIRLPAGKNIPKKYIATYKSHIKKIINQKIALEKSIKDEKIADNFFNNLKIQKLN